VSLLEQARQALKSGQIQAALSLVEAQLTDTPRSPAAHLLRAQAAMQLPDFPQALAALREAVHQILHQGLEALPADYSARPALPATEQLQNRAFQVLTWLRSEGIPAFPFFGTLLGLVRDGQPIRGDKDIDLGVWLE